MKLLSPSILSADFANLGENVKAISDAGAQLVHIDVMDGHFVPNISFGWTIMKSLDKIETPPYDIHLMIENPDDYIENFLTEKTEYIVVHQEACRHLNRTLSKIKNFEVKCGVSLNPATSIETLKWVIDQVDLVLIMSVNPGFGGQKFIETSLEKVDQLVALRKEKDLNFLIEMDGGINLSNVERIKNRGVDIIVAGSAIYSSHDLEMIKDNTKEFLKIING